jgi:hypothetical protein
MDERYQIQNVRKSNLRSSGICMQFRDEMTDGRKRRHVACDAFQQTRSDFTGSYEFSTSAESIAN